MYYSIEELKNVGKYALEQRLAIVEGSSILSQYSEGELIKAELKRRKK